MPIETIVVPADRSDSALDLQTDFIFGGNDRTKIKKKFFDGIKSVVPGRYINIALPSFIAGSEHLALSRLWRPLYEI